MQLVVPSAPEVTGQLDPSLAEHELLAAEEYLLEQGHITPANLGLTWGTYTVTLAGLDWLDDGYPWPSEAPQTPAADMVRAEGTALTRKKPRKAQRAPGGRGC